MRQWLWIPIVPAEYGKGKGVYWSWCGLLTQRMWREKASFFAHPPYPMRKYRRVTESEGKAFRTV